MDYLARKEVPGGAVIKIGRWKKGPEEMGYQILGCLDGSSDIRCPVSRRGKTFTEDQAWEMYNSIKTAEDFKKCVAKDREEPDKVYSA